MTYISAKTFSIQVTGLGTLTPCHKLAEIGYRLDRNVDFLSKIDSVWSVCVTFLFHDLFFVPNYGQINYDVPLTEKNTTFSNAVHRASKNVRTNVETLKIHSNFEMLKC